MNLKERRMVWENPWLLLISAILGIIVSNINQNIGNFLKPFSVFYLNMLQFSVIPFIFITLVNSVAKMTMEKTFHIIAKKICISILGLLFICASISIIIAICFKLAKGLDKDPAIEKIISQNATNSKIEITIKDKIVIDKENNIFDIVAEAIPNNIFAALSQAKMLQIIVLSLIIGLALGHTNLKDGQDRTKALQAYLPVFELINKKVVSFISIGIFLLLSTQLNEIGFFHIITLVKLVGCIIFVMSLLILFYIKMISYYSEQSFLSVINSLKYVTLVAISTRSTFACIPKALEMMNRLNFKETKVSLILSFSSATFRSGSICFYCIATLFIADILNVPLNFYQYFLIIFTSIIATLASTGINSIASIQMITIILDPLHLPLGSILSLLIVIDPFTDLFETLTNVCGNCALTAINSGRNDEI